MSDSFDSNPWVIEGTGDKSASLPTYNGNTGVHVAYGIVALYWTGGANGNGCEVVDVNSERIWLAACTTAHIEPKFEPSQPLIVKGLNVSTLDGGHLYVYHT